MSEYLLALVKVISSYDKFIEVVDIYNGIYACLFAVINNLLNSLRYSLFIVYVLSFPSYCPRTQEYELC